MSCTIKKICEIANVSSGLYLQTIPDGEVAYLQVKDYSHQEPVKTAFKVAATKRTSANLLRKGDVLFAGKGASYLSAVFDEDIPAVASTSLFVIRITSAAICPEYLCWFLRQRQTQSYFKTFQTCTVTPLIRKSDIEELEVVVPEMNVQDKVVKTALLAERAYQLRIEIAQKEQFKAEQLIMQLIN